MKIFLFQTDKRAKPDIRNWRRRWVGILVLTDLRP